MSDLQKFKGSVKFMTKRGRPNRAAASAKALAKVNVDAVNPLQILREIASDSSAPASARVAAARSLLAHLGKQPEQGTAPELDAVSRRALRILEGGRK
ncbi:hypothetical protein ACFSOZ_30755 [Mesorhizobium newzealandense]|uniref:Uncharacterized protein n=1 Tax=Mesorhizobium newzealandense TaxID=1300302 RepID=A0ABW4UBE9_9HYPH